MDVVAQQTVNGIAITVKATPDHMRYQVIAKDVSTGRSAQRAKTYKGESAWSDAQRDVNDLLIDLNREADFPVAGTPQIYLG